MRTYTLKPHQIKMYNQVKNLDSTRLNYYVFQQSLTHPNLTLNEMKKFIRRSVKRFCFDKGIQPPLYSYNEKEESNLVKYFCVFEMSKDFFHSQHANDIVNEDIKKNLGFHFHLFVSFDRSINQPDYFSHYLFEELTSQKNKAKSFSKFDYMKIDKLDEDFFYYHTKQMMFRYEPEMILKN